MTAKAYSGATQTVPDDTVLGTALTFTGTEFDPDGYWSGGSPGRLTVPAGKGGVPFLIFGGSYSPQNPAADCNLVIAVNGSIPRGGSLSHIHANNGGPSNGIGILDTNQTYVVLNDGDYVELRALVDNGLAGMTFGHGSVTYAQTWLALIRNPGS